MSQIAEGVLWIVPIARIKQIFSAEYTLVVNDRGWSEGLFAGFSYSPTGGASLKKGVLIVLQDMLGKLEKRCFSRFTGHVGEFAQPCPIQVGVSICWVTPFFGWYREAEEDKFEHPKPSREALEESWGQFFLTRPEASTASTLDIFLAFPGGNNGPLGAGCPQSSK